MSPHACCLFTASTSRPFSHVILCRRYRCAYTSALVDQALGEGLLFGLESASSSCAEASPEDNDFKQTMDDLRSLAEYNSYVVQKDGEMRRLKEQLEGMMACKASQVDIDRKCKEIEVLGVQNLEMFKLAQEVKYWENWLDDPKNIRSALYSKALVKIDLLNQEIKRRGDANRQRMPTVSAAELQVQTAEIQDLKTQLRRKGWSEISVAQEEQKLKAKHAQLNASRVPFQYEDVLISVHFDGFGDAEKHTALCCFPKTCCVSHIIQWLCHRVLDMEALVPIDDAKSLPFSLYRNGLLEPSTPISKVCSPPTSTITCRVKLRESASDRLPFQVQPRGGQYLSDSVKDHFPKLKITDFEADRIAKVKEDLKRKEDRAKYEANVKRHPAFEQANIANKPVLWRFRKPDGRYDQGSLTCDKLRDFLNQGHFDDATKFGALSPNYSFSFDASNWQNFRTHSEMLRHTNAQATERSLSAVHLTLQATVAAAFQTWPAASAAAAAAAAAQVRDAQDPDLHIIKNKEKGLLSVKLPLLPGIHMATERMAKIFESNKNSVDALRDSKVPKLAPLFCDAAITCRVGRGPDFASSEPLPVEFFFPAFLSLDLVMRDKEGLQMALESMIFDFYFQQSLLLVQPLRRA